MDYDIDPDPCAHCGSHAMEVPDESGRTWCADCGQEADAPGTDDEESLADEDEPRDRRGHHRPHVAETRERPLAEQVSERLSGAHTSAKRAYTDTGSGDR